MKRVGLFAGSFDPLTLGHLDLIERSTSLFDEIIVLVSVNSEKKTLFTLEERLDQVKNATEHLKNVSVDYFSDGLVVDYAKEHDVTALIRGVRNATDYEYESVIATVNHIQMAEIETVFLLSRQKYRYLSSSIVREVAQYQGNIENMVPKVNLSAIQQKYTN